MTLDTLKEAFNTIARVRLLWWIGIVTGVLGATELLMPLYLDSFFTDRVWILQLLIIPIFIGGAFSAIQDKNITLSVFFHKGVWYYFKVLLPLIVIFFAAIVTTILVLLPLALIGIPTGNEILSLVTLGVTLPFIFFAFFYDAAAIFEERKVFDSIRRSVEFVMQNTFQVVIFFIVNLVLVLSTIFITMLVWTALLYQKLEPLLQMDPAQVQSFTTNELIGIIGPDGVWITALLSLAAITFLVTLLTAYKACFFRRYAGNVASASTPVLQGEYDSKGRWYKY